MAYDEFGNWTDDQQDPSQMGAPPGYKWGGSGWIPDSWPDQVPGQTPGAPFGQVTIDPNKPGPKIGDPSQFAPGDQPWVTVNPSDGKLNDGWSVDPKTGLSGFTTTPVSKFTPPTTTSSGTGTGGGGGGYAGGASGGWNMGMPSLPGTPHYTAPDFHPPNYTPPPAFKFDAPTYASAQDDPGYQFAVGQGRQAMEQSAAAKGVLNTGGTLKDLINYGQSAGSQQYQNVWNRDWQNQAQTYATNAQTQYLQPYQFAYQSAMDQFAPKMAEFEANVGAGNLGYSTEAANGWNQYLQNYQQFKDKINWGLGLAT